MAAITATMSVTAKQNVFLQASRTDDQGNVTYLPNASIFTPENYSTFQNFVCLHQPFTSSGGDTTYKKNSNMRYEGTGLGDIIHTTWATIRGPAIIPDTANGYKEAFYSNYAPFQAISWIEIKSGNMKVIYMDDLLLQQDYTRDHPMAKLDCDLYVHRFPTKALLKTYSRVNPTWQLPICSQFNRQNKFHNAWFQYLFARQTVEWTIKLRPVKEFCEHVFPSGTTTTTTGMGTAKDTAPLVYGTSSAVTESNFSVELWGTFYILDYAERQMYLDQEFNRQLHCYRHDTITSNEGVNVLVQKDNFIVNDITRNLSLTFQPDEYLAGTILHPCNPGFKHRYEFRPFDKANGLDEWFTELQWIQNGLKLLENNPISFLRHTRHVECFGEPSKQPWHHLANQPALNTSILIRGVNFSRVDKFAVSWRKNTAKEGAFHWIQDYITLLHAERQIGGVPFQ